MPDHPAAEDREISGPCPNCGDATPGHYCPNCGQRRIERRVTLRRMLAEAVEDQLSLNAALPRTVRALLVQPGLLSREYVNGRIQRYIPPFRLYLISSLVFFLVLSFATNVDEDNFIRIDVDDAAAAGAGDAGPTVPLTPADSLAAARAAADSLAAARAMADSAMHSWMRDFRFQSRVALLDSAVNRKVREFDAMSIEQAMRAILDEMVRRTPTTMFLLLPVFAALLKLLYISRKRFYVEHFVFGLHTHAFTFLMFTLALLMPGWVDLLLILWVAVYTYIAMQRFYERSWLETLVKFGVLSMAYGLILSVAMTATFVIAIMLV